MNYRWESCPQEIRVFVFNLLTKTQIIIEDRLIGCYLHGSLAMGGFNPDSSDIDLIIITENPLTVKAMRRLAVLYLENSNRPYPIEVSFLNASQLDNWSFPTPYDFHYSEYWRKRYEDEIKKGTALYLNGDEKKDGDLAAHIMMLNHRGVCIAGKPIRHVFPSIPQSDFLTSILRDYEDCLNNIEHEPIYCILNLIRVYWYLKDENISSKQEAGKWGASHLPPKFHSLIHQVAEAYASNSNAPFDKNNLLKFRDYLSKTVKSLLN
ncbi:aminoglycoside adenylyltransferase domain-containing protein [Psychrobacillus sp. NPDC096623]|uniref:aminoglycoside adenylyltransferase domain-containing protein n=1 Tax=Psychrobacillus sp. NPDC096623 TaxID=3364492 RepID=UPI00382FE328